MRYAFSLLFAFTVAASPTLASDIEAGPEDAARAVVVVHDWFGVTPFYEDAVARLVDAGYRVHAVDLYDGQSASTHEEAGALMEAIDMNVARAEVQAAFDEAAANGRQVAVVGFSMGGSFAFHAATQNAADALVILYGATPADSEALAMLNGPALAIYGSLDGNAAERAMAFSHAADAVEAAVETHVFARAHHAFAQPLFNAGATYEPELAGAAWMMTLNFLDRAFAEE